MIDDSLKIKVKEKLADYLTEKGKPLNKLFNCLNPNHTDKHPSMSFNPKSNVVKCFSCGTSYDIISLFALDNNLDEKKDFKLIIEKLANKYNIPIPPTSDYTRIVVNHEKEKKQDFTRYFKQCEKAIGDTDYLQKRGLTDEIIKKYKIGYDLTKKAIIMPISKTYYEARTVDENNPIKHIKPKGLSNELFNSRYLQDSDFKTVVWITESIIDSLSLEQADESIKSISLNSVNNAMQLINEAKANEFKGLFILALDTDKSGLETSEELKQNLEAIGIKTIVYNNNYDKYDIDDKRNKDINELLLCDKERFNHIIANFNDLVYNGLIKQAITTYEKENALSYLDEFNEMILNHDKNKPLSTGISELDTALEGGFYKKNLVILGAISSLGKTTLALQIADNVARKGEDVLIFSLEMSKEELIAKSLSRLSYLVAYDMRYTAMALTTRDVLSGKGVDEDIPNNKTRQEIYEKAIQEYKDNIASRIYITECNEDIEINIKTINEKIKNHIAITNKKPFVVIDYLQIIQNQEKGLTDKQVIDKIVTSLKRIARDNDITILLISAFNRASYNQESNLASFRDSSTIEYTSDVLISLQHEKLDGITETTNKVNTNQEQQKDERELTLKILKNRNGRITDVKGITFYAKYNYMRFN